MLHQAGNGRFGIAELSIKHPRYVGGQDANNFYTLYRPVNHLCPVRREIAMQARSISGKPFPESGQIAWRGEDVAYAYALRPLLKTEWHIDRVLYNYKRFK